MRHLYDLYEINKAGLFTNQFEELVPKIVMDDRKQYRNHNDAYYCNLVAEIERALEVLKTDLEWRNNWKEFVDVMVYDKEKPSYEEVMKNLQIKSEVALERLREVTKEISL